MNRITIDIPNAPYQAAGQIIVDALRESGMNPNNPEVQSNPMVGECLGVWGRGEWTREEFVKAMRNLTILNPGLTR